MGLSKFIVSNQREEFICVYRIKIFNGTVFHRCGLGARCSLLGGKINAELPVCIRYSNSLSLSLSQTRHAMINFISRPSFAIYLSVILGAVFCSFKNIIFS